MTAKDLVKIMRDQFTIFGVAENLTSDDGSQFRAHDTQFLNREGVEHRNTPIMGLGLSPKQILFGRSIKDLLPVRGGNYKTAETWITCREQVL